MKKKYLGTFMENLKKFEKNLLLSLLLHYYYYYHLTTLFNFYVT